MCFALYAGLESAFPEAAWNSDDPGIYVTALSEEEAAVRPHLTSAYVQYVGSSEGCGCGFRHVAHPTDPYYASDEEALALKDRNHRDLAKLLAEPILRKEPVRLFGCWEGDWYKPLAGKYSIRLSQLIDPSFAFAENCVYIVSPD